ncbi:undecaprenyldiphospho-muramoylpentapeptide beta-N-acetylglucosaminyltransferase [Macrococcus equipercicus]|uniref:UDP-N-acetylglucosamine--N-acetylmuramyl-(pentapeptide) pyrophosphoryl-undecaprenol N-acetylglucosamine transferase n=1 Tax=Macrococcus equipercicus TaxID=69967 RepID=A0A9Q9F0G3_9STAP|nr:undecaprenyldiphospho-muramoylpentapeptide beta-N-acetylglucosaminyltransferase [Macrococcus equipercicus]KAA1040233.1 undecaprenyldiphospho-muramoylpentapeptide beta-N-acetylglucosaminyltransferase [Macrococcus equipercicus]UTH12822.1 undecaprenyldiphospho-muramoylpentapeptide beta-N-acetylglucosaminyltransferase [Macrococcus equipercicus]
MKIAFTGGGSIGHVAVNMALIPEAAKHQIECIYIGSKAGIEKEAITSQFPDVKYYGISSGKLRRYFSLDNAKDILKVQKGVFDALNVLRKERPDIVFSKGGFVTVPVIIAARMLKIKTIIHESDVTPGLANKIGLKFAMKCYTTFEETLKYIPGGKADFVGGVVRDDIFTGDKNTGYELTGFSPDKQVLLVMGGSLGSKTVNTAIRSHLDALLRHYQVIHITGQGLTDQQLDRPGYKQFEFVKDELPHLFAITDTIVSRAGSNAIYEFLALRKPMLLVPLGLDQSRGDQIDNARIFEQEGYAGVLQENELTSATLMAALQKIEDNRAALTAAMNEAYTSFTPEALLQKILDDAS